MNEYKISMTGEYEILVLSPEIIALLVEKVKISENKELHIPAEEILPQGYADYLARVLEANMGGSPHLSGIPKINDLVAEQIKLLTVNEHKCFDRVMLRTREFHMQFELDANAAFFVLAKQKAASFVFVVYLS